MDPVSDIAPYEESPAAPAAALGPRALVLTLSGLVGLLGACALIGRLGTGAPVEAPAALALTLGLYVGVRQVGFEVGGTATTARQAALVALWFLVPPALLPVALLVAEGAARGVECLRGQRGDGTRPSIPTSLAGAVPAAWPAVGPALVLAAAAPAGASVADAPLVLVALAAQFVVVAGLRVAAPSGARLGAPAPALSLPVRDRLRQLRGLVLLDAALAPLGLLVAVVAADAPVFVLAIAPVAVLLGQFAKERDERMVRAQELSHAYRGTAQLMGDVLEADDAYTGGEHTEGVVELSLEVGRRLGLGDEAMRNLEFGALLHDVGKLRVPNEIINKPGKLDEAEWAIIKEHPRYGQEMLDRVGGALSEAAPIVRAHHERWDGDGYPDGLAGAAIPIEARIITACDSFSAMTTNRSYRRAMTHLEAVEELERCSGSQFDPAVVAALRAAAIEGAPAEAGSPLSEVPQVEAGSDEVAPSAMARSDGDSATPSEGSDGPGEDDPAARAA